MDKVDSIIFDLDGTLVYTNSDYIYETVGKILRELNTTGTKQDINKFWFEARRNEIIKKKFRLDPKDFWPVFRKVVTIKSRKENTKPYHDVDFIKELKERGYKLGIVTGAPPNIANLEIEMLGKENFDGIIIAHPSNGIKSKPHPYGLKVCLNLIGTTKERAVYIGNSDEDILTARNAGVFDVLLLRGEHEFPDIKPSLTINSLYDLKKHLKF